jgi:hypothetical protein
MGSGNYLIDMMERMETLAERAEKRQEKDDYREEYEE